MPGTSRTTTPTRRDVPASGQKTRQVWTPQEDRKLSEAVAKETPKHGPVSWHKVAAHLPGRNNKDCRKRWHYSIANTIRKGTWMREEDERLREAVEIYGARWSKIAEAVGTRNGDQCWKRWYDCLDPRIDKSPWTAEEDTRLLELVSKNGRNWSDIVHQHFPNRTSLSAKNRYSILRRKQANAASRAKAASSTSSPNPSQTLSVPATPSPAFTTPEPDSIPRWMNFSEAEIDGLLQLPFQLTSTESWCTGSDTSASPSPYMGCDLEWTSPNPSTMHVSWPSPTALGVDSNLLAPPSDPMTTAYYSRSQPPAALTACSTGMGYDALGIYQTSADYSMQGSNGVVYGSGDGLAVQSTLGDWQLSHGSGW